MTSYPDAAAAAMQQQAAFSVDGNVPYPPMAPHPPGPVHQPTYSDNQPPGVLPTPSNPHLPQHPPQNQQQPQTAANRPRLRKACDACSMRKVKCDESQPCRPCAGLGIECKFERPSRRRGPPNRHAEALKRQRLGSPDQSGHSSPTHAARTLASFAQQQVLSIESIAPPVTIFQLVDDYFTAVHPLIPIPHEPTFRDRLERRDDHRDPSFLALVASMVGYVVAALPRSSQHHLRSQNVPAGPPEMRNFIDRCHNIATQARGANYLSRDITPDDAMVSYFLGITGTFTSQWHIARIYLEQALTMSHILGLHKPNGPDYVNIDGSALVNQTGDGQDMLDSRGPTDFVLQELGRRLFWLIFVAIKRLQQLGMPSEELAMLPAGKSRQYPPLPMEADDRSLMHDGVLPQPPGTLSELSGFNALVRIYLSYNKLSIVEMAGCVPDLSLKETEKLHAMESLRLIKQVVENLPFNINFEPRLRMPSLESQTQYPQPMQGLSESTGVDYPNDRLPDAYAERNRLRFEVQKAEIAVTQLMGRLYVVKEYIVDNHLLNSTGNGVGEIGESQSLSHGLKNPSASGSDQPEQSKGGLKEMEQLVFEEHEEITKTLIALLGKVNLYSIQLPGTSLIKKVQDLATTLIRTPYNLKGPVLLQADEFLNAALDLVGSLDYLNPNTQPGNSIDENESLLMRHWAIFESLQARFARTEAV